VSQVAVQINLARGAVTLSLLQAPLAARAGANLNELAVGFGFAPLLLKNFDFQLDYSFVLPLAVQDTSGSHRLSLIVRFLGNKPVVKTVKAKAPEVKPAKPEPVKPVVPAEAPQKPKKAGKVHAIFPEN